MGSYLQNGVYLPELSETPWGDEMNENLSILSETDENNKQLLQQEIDKKVSLNSNTEQTINSDIVLNGNLKTNNVIDGSIKHAINADHADNANFAVNATDADHATNAGHANSSDTANYSNSARNADHASQADYATDSGSAVNDAAGNVITDTYLTIDAWNNANIPSTNDLLNLINDHVGNTSIHTTSNDKSDISTNFSTVNNNITNLGTDLTNLTSRVQTLENYDHSVFAKAEDVYTKTDSDIKFAKAGSSYTTSDSDERYPLKDDVYTKTDSDSKYVALSGDQTINDTKTFNKTVNADISGNAETCTVKFLNAVNNRTDLAAMKSVTPPTLQDVFNEWYRFSHYGTNGQFNVSNASDNSAVLADINAWGYNADENFIYNSKNTSSYVGFVSPKKYKKFSIMTKLTSYDSPSFADDDLFSIIVGFMTDSNGTEHTLSLTRTGGAGGLGDKHFCLVYDSNNPTQIILIDKGSELSNFTWPNNYAYLKVVRDGQTLTCYTSQANSSTLSVSFTYTLPSEKGSLTDDAYKNISKMLGGKSQIGFGLQSQEGKFYLMETEGLFDSTDIYDSENNEIYTYNKSTGEYVLTSRKMSDEIPDNSRIYNRTLEKYYIYCDGELLQIK